MAKVDLELKKAFLELQDKQNETTRNLKFADVQIEMLLRSKQLASIHERQINTLPEETKVYESVGRMFILTPLSQVKDSLKKKQTSSDDKIKTLETKKGYLENNLKEATNSLRELVQQKKVG